MQVAARIQETPAWNRAVEKYQDLGPNAQKATLAGASLLAVLILFLIPWAFFSSSMDSLTDFENKKTEIRSLYRVSRAASALPPSQPPITSAELRSKVQSLLDSERPSLVPEQRLSTLDFEAAKTPDLPVGLDKIGLMVSLGKLNLNQIVTISSHLDQLHPAVKMTGMKISASMPDPHYFDVTYKLVASNLPPVLMPTDTKGKKSQVGAPKGKE